MVFTHTKAGTSLKLYVPIRKRLSLLAVVLLLFSLWGTSCNGAGVASENIPTSSTNNYASALVDTEPPYVDEINPSPGSIDIRTDAEITLHIKDEGSGINKDSIKMKVKGVLIAPVVTGQLKDYTLVYAAPEKYAPGEEVKVEIWAADLSNPPLSLEYSYSVKVTSNIPPVLEEIGDKTMFQNELIRFPVIANDEEGDTLSYSATGLPEGAEFDVSSRIFTWVPESAGVYDINFSVDDGKTSVTKPVRITVQPKKPLKLNVVFYGTHDAAALNKILSVYPEYLTVNTAHGLWGEIYGYNTGWLVHDVSKYREAGIKVMGYITTGYQGTGSGSGMDKKWYTLEMNKKLIKNMAEIDRVDGVFFDECSAFPDAQAKEYLKELTGYAHRYGLLVWGNAGQGHFDPWFFTEGGFDFMHSTEQWRMQQTSDVEKKWGTRISITGYRNDYTVEDAVKLTLDAWEKGIAYCYICTTGYDTLPAWFEEYGRQLRASGDLP